MMRKFAISDIHGCLETFKALLSQIAFSKSDQLYLLGDYIDRGPDSKGVIDYIWQLQHEGYFVHCLRGNHEQMLLDSFNDPFDLQLWQNHGGLETMSSFNVETIDEVPLEYLQWIDDLPFYIEIDDYFLVHAGLNFDLPNPYDGLQAMIWIRSWHDKIKKDWLGDRIIVHGHTPTEASTIRQNLVEMQEQSAIIIDGGCVYDIEGLGNLFALELGAKQLHMHHNIEPEVI